MTELLSTTRNDGIVQWTLNRPEALNAVNYDVMAALEAALDSIEQNADARMLLFTASGETFISGGDLKAFSMLKTAQDGRQMADRMKAILERIESLTCITVCLVNGDAYGGGCETALAFDQIWLRDTAKMGFTQANFALSPGWGGHTRLIERVGSTTAIRWLAERARVSADEAVARGLIDHIIPSANYRESIDDHIRAISHTDPAVLLTLKSLKQSSHRMNRDVLFAREAELFEQLWASDEHHARVERFLFRSRNRD
jgi:enoyl-CoA hydratase/carnithine racemase